MAITEDIDVFLADFGVTAKFGTKSATVIFDTPDQIIGGDSISGEYQITYNSDNFTDLSYNDTLTVDGDSYIVHYTQKIDDGKLTIARLSKS